MELTTSLMRRFCKNCNMPITIFHDQYFYQRIELFDQYFGAKEKLKTFIESIAKFDNEQDYFEHYNSVKDRAINYIKESAGYIKFNEMDMTEISKEIAMYKLPASDIYKVTNDGEWFISIDMKQANFYSLKHFSPDIFGNAAEWENFIGRFTTDRHIIESKYVRQVILGNCNPKRHITYEKYLMCKLVAYLVGTISLNDIVSLTNDEIVLKTCNNNDMLLKRIKECSSKFEVLMGIPLKIEMFQLKYMGDGLGFIKLFSNGKYKLKCVDNDYMPMILRILQYGYVNIDDLRFSYKDAPAKFDRVPTAILKSEFLLDIVRKKRKENVIKKVNEFFSDNVSQEILDKIIEYMLITKIDAINIMEWEYLQ